MPDIRMKDSHIRVLGAFPWKDDLKRMGGRFDRSTLEWVLPGTIAAAEGVARLFRNAGYVGDPAFQALLEEARIAWQAKGLRVREDLPDIPGKTEAWTHQRQAFHFAKHLPAPMLGMDMGTGKTRVAIGLAEEWTGATVLVLCPRSVVGVWPDQLEQHSNIEWSARPVDLRLKVKDRAVQVAEAIYFMRANPGVVIVNQEAAWRPPMGELLLSQHWDLVIVDESHRGKSAGGKFSLFLNRLREKAGHRICLTGTPMPHSPLDIYAQYRFLDPGIFGTSAHRFKQRYAIMGGYENRQIIGWQNEDELAEKIGSIAFFCKAEDVLDLEEPIHTKRETVFESKTRRTYEKMKNDLIVETKAGTVTAANGAVKVLRLQQITSGWLRTEEGNDVVVGSEKADLLRDVLEDVPNREPLVIFGVFHHDLDAIHQVCRDQGRITAELSGRTKPGRDNWALTPAARMREDIDVAVVQIQAGGVGIDLTRSRYGIYYSVGNSLGDYLQSLKRLHRPGQERLVEYIHLLVRGTVDPTVYRALQRKEDLVNAVVEAAKRGDLE